MYCGQLYRLFLLSNDELAAELSVSVRDEREEKLFSLFSSPGVEYLARLLEADAPSSSSASYLRRTPDEDESSQTDDLEHVLE